MVRRIVAIKYGPEAGSSPHRRRIAAGGQRLEMIANEIRAGKLRPLFQLVEPSLRRLSAAALAFFEPFKKRCDQGLQGSCAVCIIRIKPRPAAGSSAKRTFLPASTDEIEFGNIEFTDF